jgi:hypothetical protein
LEAGHKALVAQKEAVSVLKERVQLTLQSQALNENCFLIRGVV